MAWTGTTTTKAIATKVQKWCLNSENESDSSALSSRGRSSLKAGRSSGAVNGPSGHRGRAPVGVGQPRDAFLDLLRPHTGVGDPQRVLTALDQEVGALHEHEAALLGRAGEGVDIRALGQLDPHEV